MSGAEKLVAIIELKKRGDSDEDAMRRLDVVKREVTSAISKSHGLSVADLVLVAAWLDSHHHKRQDQTRGVCRAVSARISSPA